MVFLGGPRQVGKTTLAKHRVGSLPGYLNWDVPRDRELILRGLFPAAPLLALDEIHKYRDWRALVKGLFDGRPEGQRILVTTENLPPSRTPDGIEVRSAWDFLARFV